MNSSQYDDQPQFQRIDVEVCSPPADKEVVDSGREWYTYFLDMSNVGIYLAW